MKISFDIEKYTIAFKMGTSQTETLRKVIIEITDNQAKTSAVGSCEPKDLDTIAALFGAKKGS